MTLGVGVYRAVAGMEYRHNTPDSESQTQPAPVRSPSSEQVVETVD